MKVAFQNVCIALGGTPIVHDVSFTAPSGSVVGILGPNGCGKSTLLRSLYRVNKPTSGSVTLDGDDVRKLTSRQAALRVAVMAQESSQDFPMTAREVVMLGRAPHQRGFGADSDRDHHLVHHALLDVGASSLANRFFGGLSGGEKQRILLARALVQEAPVLVLDEPTNHVDVAFQLELMQLVTSRGRTVLAALHDMNLAAEFCDHVAVLQSGRLRAFGPPSSTLDHELIRRCFGVESRKLEHPLTGKALIAVAATRASTNRQKAAGTPPNPSAVHH
ncbi:MULTISPECIES: ABC transporter ATP-binding protein [Paenarthrobacter]|uniref:ABC transporter ATP-binding protein n=1 Tax=Paenarthrobacter TaxID=1742992 RepID=UPI001FCB7967|nr:ABC transporter ATP-binding protein [Paenarthrobacter nitroguajacolicus]